jgi:peptidoglycan hydrolase CwlO-like protein
MKFFLSIIVTVIIFGFSGAFAYAQVSPSPSSSPSSSSPTPDSSNNDSSTVEQLNQRISDLQQKVSDLKSQGDSLSSQIGVMDNQIQLTQYKISSTQKQIMSLTMDIDSASKRMGNLENSLTNVTKVLLSHIVATYQAGSASDMQVLLSSSDISDMLTKENYLRFVQEHDQQLLYDTQQARVDYANQKNILEDQKKQVLALNTQLQQYTQDLNSQKSAKQDLLTQTQGDEATYERLLEQTKAQLASFSSFATSQGGASLLDNQTVCDDWGCYYNQRDSQWGGIALNGTQYSIASVGCLMTSMAMVYTHYGHKDVTPLSINSNGGNFSGIPAALLNFSVSANGIGSSRTRLGSSSGAIPNTISDPIIVGISYDGGPYPDHFVVLISGSGGNYQMNDPFTPNGHNIPFTSKYSLGSIVEVDQVSM